MANMHYNQFKQATENRGSITGVVIGILCMVLLLHSCGLFNKYNSYEGVYIRDVNKSERLILKGNGDLNLENVSENFYAFGNFEVKGNEIKVNLTKGRTKVTEIGKISNYTIIINNGRYVKQ